MANYFQGKFKPINPKKYKGDVKNICYRSSWECKYMMELDRDPTVVEWASEEIWIPYTHPATGRFSRYFPDFFVKKKDKKTGIVETYLIEIKPKHQALMPKRENKSKKRFITEAVTYEINQAKWGAAERFCQKHNIKFVVLTEDQLFPKSNQLFPKSKKN